MKKILLLFVVFMGSMVLEARRVFKKSSDQEGALVLRSGSLKVDNELSVDASEKRKKIIALVKKGIAYFHDNGLEQSARTFMNNKDFVDGDSKIFVLGLDGTVYVMPPFYVDTWKDYSTYENAHDIAVFDLLKAKVQEGGGWVDYEWNGAYQVSYVEKITREEKDYIIGVGWYPVSRRAAVKNLVKSGVSYIKRYGPEKAFNDFSNPFGSFVRGDTYLFVIDHDYVMWAHGNNPSLVGLNRSSGEDAQLEVSFSQSNKSGWLRETWRNTEKVVYLETIEYKGKKYAVGAGYYPAVDKDSVVNLVKRGVGRFYKWGLKQAIADFSNRNQEQGDYLFGSQFLILCRFDGMIVGHGDNSDMIGQNRLEMKTPLGRFVIKESIELAKKGGGWLKYRQNNALFYSYVEKVHDADGNYFISSGYYPHSPIQVIENLVAAGAEYFADHTLEESLQIFSQSKSEFTQGAHFIFMFTMDGDCLVYGPHKNLVWKNFIEHKDEDGQKVVKALISKSKKGGGWVSYASHNANKWAYVKKIKKDGMSYIIGSAFYT